MIVSLILSKWKTILDIALILGLIFLIFYINPWNIFGKNRELQPTANLVSQIREIGQLVTAEYYGEVIASYEEGKLNFLLEDSINDAGEFMLSRIKSELVQLIHYDTLSRSQLNDLYGKEIRKRYKNGVTENSIVEQFHNQNNGLPRDSMYYLVLDFIRVNSFNENSQIDKLIHAVDNKPKRRGLKFEGEVLYKLYSDLRNSLTLGGVAFDNYLVSGFETINSFSDYYYGFERENWTRKEEKKELALIGRGWVKAGYDFGNLDEDRFIYDEKSHTIHLFGVNPVILDKDINPWFIPQREVPGFQILHYNRHVKFEDVVNLKSYCIDKLSSYATRAGILSRAEEYGKISLQGFFSLLTGDEILNVIFHTDSLNIYVDHLLSDKKISQSELPIIDSIYCQYYSIIDSTEKAIDNAPVVYDYAKDSLINERRKEILRKFTAKLRDYPLALSNGRVVPFNYFTRKAAVLLLSDTLASIDELSAIDTLREKWGFVDRRDTTFASPLVYKSEKYWFKDSLQFINDYNGFIAQIQTKNIEVIDHIIDTAKADSVRLGWEKNRDLSNKLLTERYYWANINYESWDRFIEGHANWPGDSLVNSFVIGEKLIGELKLDAIFTEDKRYAETVAIKKVLRDRYVTYSGETGIIRASNKFNAMMSDASENFRSKLTQARRNLGR